MKGNKGSRWYVTIFYVPIKVYSLTDGLAAPHEGG